MVEEVRDPVRYGDALWYEHQSPVSISDRTSYCEISWSLEAARFVFRFVRLLWYLSGTSAALLPVKCESDTIHLNYHSRDFETSRDLIIRRLVGYWNGSSAAWHNTAYNTIINVKHTSNFELSTGMCFRLFIGKLLPTILLYCYLCNRFLFEKLPHLTL